MATDYRALCAELLEELEHTTLDYYLKDLKARARAALAEPAAPANETEFVWELQDANGDWLSRYSLDGDHALIIRKQKITPISEVTYG